MSAGRNASRSSVHIAAVATLARTLTRKFSSHYVGLPFREIARTRPLDLNLGSLG